MKRNGPMTVKKTKAKTVYTHYHPKPNPTKGYTGIMFKKGNSSDGAMLMRVGHGNYRVWKFRNGKKSMRQFTTLAEAKKAYSGKSTRKNACKTVTPKRSNITRSRCFVGETRGGKYKAFRCIYNPTRKSHGKKFVHVYGPMTAQEAKKLQAKNPA